MSVFQMLSAGNMGQLPAPGTGVPALAAVDRTPTTPPLVPRASAVANRADTRTNAPRPVTPRARRDDLLLTYWSSAAADRNLRGTAGRTGGRRAGLVRLQADGHQRSRGGGDVDDAVGDRALPLDLADARVPEEGGPGGGVEELDTASQRALDHE